MEFFNSHAILETRLRRLKARSYPSTGSRSNSNYQWSTFRSEHEHSRPGSRGGRVVGASYCPGPDGRGTISISTNDQDLGANGVESFSFVFLSSSQALITALPTSTLLVSATGTMDLQTSTAAPAAGYAFVVSGTDFSSGSLPSIAGVFNIDSPNNISGKGNVADENLSGAVTAQKKYW